MDGGDIPDCGSGLLCVCVCCILFDVWIGAGVVVVCGVPIVLAYVFLNCWLWLLWNMPSAVPLVPFL